MSTVLKECIFVLNCFPPLIETSGGVSCGAKPSPVLGVVHLVEELVQFVLVSDGLVDLLPVQVVANVREVFVPLHGNVPHRVPDVLQNVGEQVILHRMLET